MEPLTSNEKRISWKRGVLEFQSQMTFLGHALSFSASTPFILAPWNGFHFLLPLFSAPRLLLPAPSQRLLLVRSLAQPLLSQLVLSPSSSVFPEMVTLMWTLPIFHLTSGSFPDLQSHVPAHPFYLILTPHVFLASLSLWFCFLSAYKFVQSSLILKCPIAATLLSCVSFLSNPGLLKESSTCSVFASSHLIY